MTKKKYDYLGRKYELAKKLKLKSGNLEVYIRVKE